MKNTKSYKVLTLILIGIIASAVLYLLNPLYRNKSYVMEVGQPKKLEVSDFLFAPTFALFGATLDTSNIKDRVGSYPVTVTYLNKEYSFTVKVVDTTPPKAKTKKDIIVCIGKSYDASDFLESYSDNSRSALVYFELDGNKTNSYTFTQDEATILTIIVEDKSGNRTKKTVSVVPTYPPQLIGVSDKTILQGESFNPLEGIVAYDDEFGYITSKVKTTGVVDTQTAGIYRVEYSITNENGLSDHAVANIYVAPNGFTQEYSSEEINAMCENGYFTIPPLANADMEDALELTKPTLVGIRQANESGIFGSGVIYKITPEYIYIASVSHVLELMKDSVIFDFSCGESITLDSLTHVSDGELALCRIRTDCLSTKCLLSIRQANFNVELYEDISIGDEVASYAPNWNNTESIVKKCAITGICDFFSADAQNCIKTNAVSISGMSGTALIDSKGNTLALLEGTCYIKGKEGDYFIRYDTLKSLYERNYK